MNFKYLLVKTILFVFLLSALDAQTTEIITTYPVVRTAAIKGYVLEPGIHDLILPLSDGTTWQMSVSIPEIPDGQDVPLVLAMHWAGDGQTYLQYADCLAFPAFAELDAILVVPSAEGRHWIDPAIEARVIHLIKKLAKHWPIRRDEIILTGYSNGAIGSWAFAQKYPKLFCTALPLAGYYEPARVEIPIYAIHGADDDLFDAAMAEQALKASIIQGSTIDLQIINDFSHYMACAYAEILRKTVRKMRSEVLQK